MTNLQIFMKALLDTQMNVGTDLDDFLSQNNLSQDDYQQIVSFFDQIGVDARL